MSFQMHVMSNNIDVTTQDYKGLQSFFSIMSYLDKFSLATAGAFNH